MQNRLIFYIRTSILDCIKKSDKIKREFSVKTDREKILESLLDSPIKSYLNIEKFDKIQPFLYTRKDFSCLYNCVVDAHVAKNVAEKILSGSDNHKRMIVEGNPGLGLITINLINSDVPHVLVSDSSKMQEVSLSQLLNKFPNKLSKKRQNMNTNSESVILTAHDYSRQYGLLWTFIGVATSFYFLRSLVLTTIKYKLWENSVDIYLLISTPVLDTLKNRGTKMKFPIHCGFYLLYTIEEMSRYPREAFIPYSAHDKEDMNLIRIKSCPHLFEKVKKEDLSEYFAFIRILGSKLDNFIISTLEKWMPDCGPYLISKGISMTNQIRDLTPSETIVLFNFVKECDGYENFKACMTSLFE